MTLFRVFGLRLASDFAFRTPLCPEPVSDLLADSVSPDVYFHCQDHPPGDLHGTTAPTPDYSSSYRTKEGDSVLYAYHSEDYDLLRFTQAADFYLWPNRIICHLLDPAQAHIVEIHLLSTVLSFYLERQGVLMLHASVVEVNQHAIAFIADSGNGKSGLAGALMQAGHALLSDDILPIQSTATAFLSYPGYPAMRMWPDQAQYFLGHYADLEKVHPHLEKRRTRVGSGGFGSFCAQPRPLSCIYVPQRCDPVEWGEAIHIEPLRPMHAVMTLMRDSFIPRLAQALGLQRARFPRLADLARQIPIRQITYPSGFHYLPRVREAILADLSAISS